MNHSNNVLLKVPEPEHTDILVKWENNPDIWHAGDSNIPCSRFAMEQFILQSQQDAFTQKQVRFMIELFADGKQIPVGTADLYDINAYNRRAGVGIMLIKEYRKKGYAADALGRLVGYAFDDLGLQQVYARIKEDNSSSIKLFRKLGFEQTGTLRAWHKTARSYEDEFFMQKLNPEYHEQEK